MKKLLSGVFFWPIIISVAALVAVGYFSGVEALILVTILSILEITLSFDNAVVNAKVLERMTPVWQRRFLTWGIAIAVFGTRFVLPIIIVSVAVWTSPWTITTLAMTDPARYGHLLESVHGSITAFGGVFLMMVALKYFFDKAKDIHWIEVLEKRFSRWGNIEAIEIALTLMTLLATSFASPYNQAEILVAGIVGLILFIIMEGFSGSLASGQNSVAASGLSLFLYLNVLDSAFSLDGVVGAFALTINLFIIVVGLGIGAYFVRAITLHLVQQKTLARLVYLEHGAHWAILGLSLAMFANLVMHIPEVIIGLIGLVFVAFSYRSSLKEMGQHTN
jgi:hypothetical protein